MEKLYVIVRNDLAPGLQAAQACHAVHKFIELHPRLFWRWVDSPNIVILQVPDRRELLKLRIKLGRRARGWALFKEPDVNNEPTAFAVSGDVEPFVAQLPLALRDVPAQSISS